MKVRVQKVQRKNLELKNYIGPHEDEKNKGNMRVVGSMKTQLNSDIIRNVDTMEVYINIHIYLQFIYIGSIYI